MPTAGLIDKAQELLHCCIFPFWNQKGGTVSLPRKQPLQILRKSSARDMRHRSGSNTLRLQVTRHIMVEPCGRKKRLNLVSREFRTVFGKDSPNKTPAICVDSVGLISYQHIARSDRPCVQHFVFFHTTDTKSRKLNNTLGNKPGHFRSFPTGEYTSTLFQVIRHPCNQSRDAVLIELCYPDIIEKHKRISSCRKDIVDAHGNKILTCILDPVILQLDLELCSHSVTPGNNHRVPVVLELKRCGK